MHPGQTQLANRAFQMLGMNESIDGRKMNGMCFPSFVFADSMLLMK
jgi:hypothetical protein